MNNSNTAIMFIHFVEPIHALYKNTHGN